MEPLRGGGVVGAGDRAGSESAAQEESGTELQTVTCHRIDHDTILRHHHDSTTTSPTEVDRGINFSLSGPKVSLDTFPYGETSVKSFPHEY